MKLVRLLCIPAVIAATALAAVPAYANHAAISKLTGTCDQTNKICVHIEVTPSAIPQGQSRTVTLQLLGHAKGAASADLTPIDGATITITLTSAQNGHLQTFDRCFEDVDTSKFDKFAVKATAGPDIDLQGSTTVQSDVVMCSTPSPSPSASNSASPSPSTQTGATATPTPAAQALAATGGFDYRFPLIGLPILVGGLALLLVTVARGRRSETK